MHRRVEALLVAAPLAAIALTAGDDVGSRQLALVVSGAVAVVLGLGYRRLPWRTARWLVLLPAVAGVLILTASPALRSAGTTCLVLAGLLLAVHAQGTTSSASRSCRGIPSRRPGRTEGVTGSGIAGRPRRSGPGTRLCRGSPWRVGGRASPGGRRP